VAPEDGGAQAHPATRPSRGLVLLREYLEAVLVAVVFALFVKAFLFEAYQIPSGSMEQNLLVGDHVVVDKFAWAPRSLPWGPLLPRREILRGDVVVFRGPEDPGRDFIKRAVAFGGETVEIRDKRLFVGGVEREEPYVVHRDPALLTGRVVPASLRGRDEMPPRTLPDGTFFALGDNRDESRDSRSWGPVARHLVKGRALFVYWSVRPPPEPFAGRGAAVRRILDGAVHFFSRTRWERTIQVVR
jgi:signal peptidase I